MSRVNMLLCAVSLLSFGVCGCATTSQNADNAPATADAAATETVAAAEEAADAAADGIKVSGLIEKSAIQDVVKAHSNDIRACYESELANTKELSGTILATWSVLPSGAVEGAAVKESTMNNANVENCLVDSISKWEFPGYEAAEGSDSKVSIDYPFEFIATAADDAAEAAPAE
jgi:outer membrane biosynthesis protein TonB